MQTVGSIEVRLASTSPYGFVFNLMMCKAGGVTPYQPSMPLRIVLWALLQYVEDTVQYHLDLCADHMLCMHVGGSE